MEENIIAFSGGGGIEKILIALHTRRILNSPQIKVKIHFSINSKML
ncbi:hypothetical protein [Helicobacter typhlonius]